MGRETEVSGTLAPGWEISQPPHTPPATTSQGRTSPWGQVLALTNEMPVLAGGPGHRGGQLLFPACLLSVARRNPGPRNQDRGLGRMRSQPSSRCGNGQQAWTGPRSQG